MRFVNTTTAPVQTVAAVYLRLSEDVEEQQATYRQEADTRTRAEHDGLEVVEVFQDLVSGYRRNVRRPGFEAATDWVTGAPGRTLYVWKLDRLSRQGIGQVGALLDRLEDARSRVVIVHENLDTSDQASRMLIAMLAEQARAESANTSVRVRRALQERKKNGLWTGGLPPFGFRIVTREIASGVKNPDAFHVTQDPADVPGRLVEHPDQAPVVREIVRRMIDGASLHGVTRWLTEEGVPTSRGGHWGSTTLKQLLVNPVLVGWLPESNRSTEPARNPDTLEPVEVGPAIISLADRRRLFAALEARSSQRRGKHEAGTAVARTRLLTGLLRCDLCGGSLVGGGRAAAGVYRCATRNNGGDCEGLAITADLLDEFVAERFIRRFANSDPEDSGFHAVAAILLGRPVVDPLGRAEREAMEAELEDLEARLDHLVTLRFEPEFRDERGAERYAAMRDPLVAAVERTRAHLGEAKAAEPDLGVFLDPVELYETWEALDAHARRGALATALGRVEVTRAKRQGAPWDPEGRVRLIWKGAVRASAV